MARRSTKLKQKEEKKTLQDVYLDKAERVLEGVAYWASYYRKNPQRFVVDYLNIKLKLFQKILIYMMMYSTNFMYIASRGSGIRQILCDIKHLRR